MANERRWDTYVSTLFTANGTQDGIATVADTFGLYTKMAVSIISNTQGNLVLQVKAVLSPTQVQLGLPNGDLNSFQDLTAFTTVDAAQISAPRQSFPTIKRDDIEQATYAREPIVGRRSVIVDKRGTYIDSVTGVDGRNRIAVDAAVTVSGITVDLDAVTPPTRPDPDNVLIVGSTDGTKGGLKAPVLVNPDGSIRQVQLFKKPWDVITGVNPDPDAVTEIYQSRVGGISGTVQETATITYRDATKKRILYLVVT